MEEKNANVEKMQENASGKRERRSREKAHPAVHIQFECARADRFEFNQHGVNDGKLCPVKSVCI